jgi:hypothetical protein
LVRSQKKLLYETPGGADSGFLPGIRREAGRAEQEERCQ